jgi:hypothetical protein
MNHWKAEPLHVWWDGMTQHRALHVSDPLVLAIEEHAGAVDACTVEVQPTRLDWRGLDRLKSKLVQGECLGFIGPTRISAPPRRR